MGLSSSKKILCIDDSQDNCELLMFILSDEGYEVETAGSVAEGVRVAQTGGFGLYLIDLSFADGTGFDLIERIQEFDLATPIIVCSGDGRPLVQEEAMRVGAQAFLLKPIDPDRLTHTIAEVLGDRQVNLSTNRTASRSSQEKGS